MLDASPPAAAPAPKSTLLWQSHNRRRWDFENAVLADDERAPFVCECPRSDCVGAVELTLHEYQTAHASPDWCAVRPGHTLAGDGARVVLRRPHFWVVELPPSRREA